MSAPNPTLVELTRGDVVESRHTGAAVIADSSGRVVRAWGDPAQLVYARSALKAVYALPLVETGAAAAFGLGEAELAAACGSHHGEPEHVGLVSAWLRRIGCAAGDLECGVHPPINEREAHALIRRDEAPTALHNNCSGKHAGFLTTARHLGEPLSGYTRREHPVQQRVAAAMSEMTGADLRGAPWGIDGCSMPIAAVPLERIALAMARLADPEHLPAPRRLAVLALRRAWASNPHLIGGAGCAESEMMIALNGRVLLKSGGEGTFVAAVPELGLGAALKIDDGASRAAPVAMAALLDQLGVLDDGARRRMASLARPRMLNRRGQPTGELRASAPLSRQRHP